MQKNEEWRTNAIPTSASILIKQPGMSEYVSTHPVTSIVFASGQKMMRIRYVLPKPKRAFSPVGI